MAYTIHTLPVTGDRPNSRDTQQFERYVGKFQSIEDAQKGARYLSNSRNLPLSKYQIVEHGDVSRVVVANIEPGEAAYIYGAHM